MLDENKIRAISLILSGKSKTDTAKILGISRPTLYNWLDNSELKEEMKNQRNDLIESCKEKLNTHLSDSDEKYFK